MRESSLKDGKPILALKIDHFVTLGVFALALTDYHYYTAMDVFNHKLSKKEAQEILKHQLLFHGTQGEFPDGFFEAAADIQEVRNSIYQAAEEWIKKNYPYWRG